MSEVINLINQKFGKLIVLERFGSNREGRALWKCRCECNNIIVVSGKNLREGHVRSCGCLVLDTLVTRNKTLLQTKNGESRSRLYMTWYNMIRRCEKSVGKDKKNYKDRGIKVCTEWHDYAVFKNWAINSGYTDELTIDRIDNNGNYEPTNCRWVNTFVQANNRSNNHKITVNGITKNLLEWSRESGINYATIIKRINLGYDIESLLIKKGDNIL